MGLVEEQKEELRKKAKEKKKKMMKGGESKKKIKVKSKEYRPPGRPKSADPRSQQSISLRDSDRDLVLMLAEVYGFKSFSETVRFVLRLIPLRIIPKSSEYSSSEEFRERFLSNLTEEEKKQLGLLEE